MGYIYFVGGTVQGSAQMGRLIDLTDFKGSGYTAGAFLKVNGGGDGFEFTPGAAAPAGVVYGDLDFSDLTCEKCKRPFQEGEELTLIVVAAGPEKIKTRPVHRFCSEVQ